MATIPDLVNTLEGTAGQNVVVAGNIDLISGGTPVYSSTAAQGSTSVEFNQNNNNSSLSFDLTSQRGIIYYDFFLQMVTVPNGSFPLVNWYTLAGGTKGGDVRIVGNGTTFNFQVRKGVANTVLPTTTWNLPTGQYRVQIKIDPDSTTGYRVQVWSVAPLNGPTPNYDTGNLDATGSGITTIGRISVGIIAAVASQSTFRVDDILADDTEAVVRSLPSSTAAYYKKNGVWISYEHFYRANNSWGNNPTDPKPTQVSTLTITPGSITSSSVALTWTVTPDASVTKYGIFRGSNVILDNIDPGLTGITVSSLTAGTSYTLDVRRSNPSGGWSDPSPTVTFTTTAASTFIFNPVMGCSNSDNNHGGTENWGAWRVYNYNNARTIANTKNPQILAVTDLNGGGGIYTNRNTAFTNWSGFLEDFYYGSGSSARTNVELHIANGNEYGDKITTSNLAGFVEGCRGIYEATRVFNTGTTTRRYPLASSWLDPTHNQEQSRNTMAVPLSVSTHQAARYLDGVGWSMYPPGRSSTEYDPTYNWPAFDEANRYDLQNGYLYRCFKRTQEAQAAARTTLSDPNFKLKIACWEIGIGDDPGDTTTRPYFAAYGLVGSMGKLAKDMGLTMSEIIWWDQQKNEVYDSQSNSVDGPHPQNILNQGTVRIYDGVGPISQSTSYVNVGPTAANAYTAGALGERASTSPSTRVAWQGWRTYNEYYGGTDATSWTSNPTSWKNTNYSAWVTAFNGFVPPPAS